MILKEGENVRIYLVTQALLTYLALQQASSMSHVCKVAGSNHGRHATQVLVRSSSELTWQCHLDISDMVTRSVTQQIRISQESLPQSGDLSNIASLEYGLQSIYRDPRAELVNHPNNQVSHLIQSIFSYLLSTSGSLPLHCNKKTDQAFVSSVPSTHK